MTAPTTLTCSSIADVVAHPADEPLVSIVIVTFGTGQIVIDCLRALTESLHDVAYEIIVVDNPTSGGMPTRDRLRLTTRGIRLVMPDTNTGFGGGNDLGIAHARGSLLCLLNPDVVVSPGWWQPLADAVADPLIAIAAPVLLNPDGTVQECGRTLDHRGHTQRLTTIPEGDVVDVDYSSAACWLMARDPHGLLGGFDPRYHPAYYEDVDLAMRAHSKGLRTVVVTASQVVHIGGASTREKTTDVSVQYSRFTRRWVSELGALAPLPQV